uniref:Calcium channel, voltage-dependent, T type, alpha 1H subunit a n=1 Tax=Cyprinus carpio TaxID=7962 RepID=A0A8C2A0C7_CYPCA
MTDGEGREHFHYLERGEVRVPISALYQAPGPSEEIGDDEEKSSTWIPVHESSQAQGSGEQPPYPALAPVVFFCIKQTTRPRSWCLRMVCNPYPLTNHVSMLVILLNCVTLGMFQPCEDLKCQSEWCIILQAFDDCIFAFFAVEMVIKMIALGIFGSKCYLGDTWNRLDFFIVMAGMMEYSLDGHNASLSAIRTVRVLRPLRAINRVPSMRILVTLLLDTLPMLGNVLLLCFFVFFIFGIVGVQLWAGLLRNRCFILYNLSHMSPYYMNEEGEDNPFICSANKENGMLRCSQVPHLKEGVECTLNASPPGHAYSGLDGTGNSSCVNWNQYYNVCKPGELNPHKGAVNFDNIGYAWIAIFQVITLEGWVDIMYYVMDAHSFYNFIYFILLIIVGSFFMINLCLVVIATQFSETKQRENQLMQEQRARYLSNDSTLASYSEPGSCYEEMLRYISHLYRKVKRRASRIYTGWQSKRRKKVNPNSGLSGGGGGCCGGGVNGHSRHRGGGHWLRSIHSLIQQHQRQHCHLSNGSPSPVTATGPGEALEMRSIATGSQLTVSSQPTAIRVLLQMAGVVPSPLLLELLNCPNCARALETMDMEHGDSDYSRSEGDVVYEFSHGAEFKPCRASHNKILEERNRLAQCWDDFRDRLIRIVDSKYFNRGIMIAILINTLSMGIEYHEQPEELTNILEISNIVFTSMFVLEMLFKLLAFGIFGYIKNPYNIFDGIIVVISVWEIIGQADGGLSVLRTFRLLRVLKLVRFLPALRRQLVVLMKTMDNVATFCMLLMLFIFTFSILGMHLFGCKFSLKMENGDTIPDRKNFDSLLWAIVTVFQILTQEDWNVVLYNGMASTTPWAALYFVALMTFGNYVLFNLLVAILVEGFQAEGDANKSDADEEKRSLKMYSLMMSANGHVDPRGTLPPPIIMRTAATPMPTPKSSLSPESVFGLTESRRGSGISIDPNTSPRRSPCHPRGSGSNWGSRRSSWNSLGRAPSLKRKDTSGERESLLSGEGRGSFEDEDLEGEKLASISGGSLQHPSSLDIPELFCFRLKRTFEAYKPKWCKDHEDWSLYLFSPQNRFRMMCQRLISHKMFDHIVLVFIFLNCITIALERPTIQPSERMFLSISNYVFTVIFVAEMTVKVVALGFCAGKHSYLQSTWNVLDGVLVSVSLIDILVSLTYTGGNRILGILRVLRLLRTLRPLRVISRAPGLKLVVETLITSLRPIGNIVLICCAFFIVFGILGVQLFKGKFYHCEGGDTKNITNKLDCIQANYKWIRRKYNFDNLGQALMSLFVLSCKDGWVNIMYDGLDAVGVDMQPERNHNPWMLLYFISFLLIVSFFVLNMFVGVVVENFHKCRQDQEEEEARLREEKRQRLLEKKRRKAQQRPYYADYSPARLYIHTLCTNHYLDLFITCIIGINVVTMSIEHFNQPPYLEESLKYCNYVFTIIFIIEALLKLVAFGFRRFFKDRWNQLDLAIVLLSIMGITLEEIKMNAALPINPTIIRIMRVLNILKLLKMATGMRALLDTVIINNIFYKYLINLFYFYKNIYILHATFENFGMAFLTLFRVSTGDNWNGIMKDTLRECLPEDKHCLTYLPMVSPIYFVTFVLMAQFVLVNVVVAVLMKHLEESNKEAKEDAEMDAEIEMEMEMARRHSNVSAGSSSGPEGRATYVGAHPDSPGQVYHRRTFVTPHGLLRQGVYLLSEEYISLPQDKGMQRTQENLLSPRKMSVSRMHSLPNDSYMFRPVRPASSSLTFPVGSITSVHSQPCESHSLLQVPGLPPHSQFNYLPKIPPPIPSPTHSIGRTLRRQVYSRSFDSKDNPDRQAGITTGSFKLHVPRIPQHGHTPSVCTFQQPHSQHSILSRPPSLACSSRSTSPSGSLFDSADLTDEEVRHINSTARLWVGVQVESRNPKKCFSVDTEGFLEKPGTDDHRRHSIEICSSVDDGLFGQELSEKRHIPMRGQSLHIPRKKKMSPPCISIEPPFETEVPASLASMKKLSESSMLLRRRTPSYDLALQRDSLDLLENQLSTQPLIKVERHPSHCAEYLSLPHPTPMGGLAGILCESTQSSPFDNRFEESTDFSSVNRTAQ